jgi:hypothetical protein
MSRAEIAATIEEALVLANETIQSGDVHVDAADVASSASPSTLETTATTATTNVDADHPTVGSLDENNENLLQDTAPRDHHHHHNTSSSEETDEADANIRIPQRTDHALEENEPDDVITDDNETP